MIRVNFEKSRNGYRATDTKADYHVVLEPQIGNRWRAKITVGPYYAQVHRRKLADLMNVVTLMLNNPTRYENEWALSAH